MKQLNYCTHQLPHLGKRWHQDALWEDDKLWEGNVMPSPANHVDVHLTVATNLNIIAEQQTK